MAFTVTTGANSGGVATATISIAVPDGKADFRDLLIVLLESQTGSPGPTCDGWTMTHSALTAGLTGTSRLSVGVRIASGYEGATQVFTCPATNNHTSGQMLKIKGHRCVVVGDVVTGTMTSGATGTVISGVSGITVEAGSLILLAASSALDLDSTAQFSGWAATDPATLDTEVFDQLVSTGNGGGIGAAYGICAGTSTGPGSVTEANSTDSWNAIMLGVKAGLGPSNAFE